VKSIQHILVGTDLSVAGGCALEKAAALSARNQARVSVVFVPGDLHLAEGPKNRKVLKKLAMDELRRHVRVHGAEGAELDVTFGSAAKTLGVRVRTLKPDLVVVGLCKGGLRRKLLGSVGERLLRFATTTPVWFTIGAAALEAAGAGDTVVVGTDASPSSLRAVRMALAEAEARGSALHIVHAYPRAQTVWGRIARRAGHGGDPELLQSHATERLKASVTALANGTAVDVSCHAIAGRGHEVLVRHARDHQANLIVVGRHGPEAVHDLFVGSTTARLLHAAEGVDVLVTPVCKELES
jgi:nucleotide-binding universal stress UspA family protein